MSWPDNLFADAIAGKPDSIVELEKHADDKTYDDGTLLHIQSKRGKVEDVRFILREFGNKNLLREISRKKETALHLAAVKGHTEVVEVLIDAAKGLDLPSANDISAYSINGISSLSTFVWFTNQDKNTALHLAVSKGNLDCAKPLAEACPLPCYGQYLTNQLGQTPVYLAVKLGHFDIVKMMCKAWKGHLPVDCPNGGTILHAAITYFRKAKENDKDVIEELIKALKPYSNFHPLEIMSIEIPYSYFETLFNLNDVNYDTVLSLAVRENYPDLVELIIKEDPAYQDGRVRKISDLKSLISIATEKKNTVMVDLLSKIYDDRKAIGHSGQTPLHRAIYDRDEDYVLQYFLEDSTDIVYTTDDHRWTPLHYAAYYDFESILDQYIHAGYLDQGMYNERSVATPFHVAAKEGHTSTLEKLMELLPASLYAAVEYRTEQNILHVAVAQSKTDMIVLILEKCPEEYVGEILNRQDINGDTPLHLLIHNGCFVPKLIKHERVDRLVKNKQGWTSSDMLYFNDKIIGDQVKVKKALDDFHADGQYRKFWQRLKFWRRSIKTESKLPERSLVPSGKRKKKDNEFLKAKKKLIKENLLEKKDELDRYRQRTNTQIIVTALITTVTFTVGFTMPGGLHQDGDHKGMVILSNKKAFIAFMVFDALALLLSTFSLFLYFIASMYEDPDNVSKLTNASTVLNIVSVIAMMSTFITGTYVVLSRALAIIVCVISCFFFLLVIIGLLIKWRYDRKQEKLHEV